MEIKGRIIHVMPLQSGIGQVSGKEWKKQEYVLETQEQYPRKVCFQVSGNRIEQYPVSVGDEVVVSSIWKAVRQKVVGTPMCVRGK